LAESHKQQAYRHEAGWGWDEKVSEVDGAENAPVSYHRDDQQDW
jgi:hypothetical protein